MLDSRFASSVDRDKYDYDNKYDNKYVNNPYLGCTVVLLPQKWYFELSDWTTLNYD